VTDTKQELIEYYARVMSYAKTLELNCTAQAQFVNIADAAQLQLLHSAMFGAVTALDHFGFPLAESHRILHEEFPGKVPTNPVTVTAKPTTNDTIVPASTSDLGRLPKPGPRIHRP